MVQADSHSTPTADGQNSFQLTYWTPKFSRTIFDVDTNSGSTQKFRTRDDKRFNFKLGYTIMYDGKLLAFNFGKPVKVWSHQNAADKAKMVKTQLQSLPFDQYLIYYSICLVKEKFVLLAGGNSSDGLSDLCFLFNCETGQWVADPA